VRINVFSWDGAEFCRDVGLFPQDGAKTARAYLSRTFILRGRQHTQLRMDVWYAAQRSACVKDLAQTAVGVTIHEALDANVLAISCDIARLHAALNEQLPCSCTSRTCRCEQSKKDARTSFDALLKKAATHLEKAKTELQNNDLQAPGRVFGFAFWPGTTCHGCGEGPIRNAKRKCVTCSTTCDACGEAKLKDAKLDCVTCVAVLLCSKCAPKHDPMHPIIKFGPEQIPPMTYAREASEPFSVNGINGKRVRRDGTREYAVRWSGDFQDEWETEEDITAHGWGTELLAAYEAKALKQAKAAKKAAQLLLAAPKRPKTGGRLR
jgi:hypothetical protein